MIPVRCSRCGRVYRVRPIWRRARKDVRCRCGNNEYLGRAFWLRVLAVRAAAVAAGAAAGFVAAALVSPGVIRHVAGAFLGAAAGAAAPELTRLQADRRADRRRARPAEAAPPDPSAVG